MSHYELIVSNIGSVWEGNNPVEANKQYGEYKRISLSGIGRGGNEDVYLFKDGEIVKEHSSSIELNDVHSSPSALEAHDDFEFPPGLFPDTFDILD